MKCPLESLKRSTTLRPQPTVYRPDGDGARAQSLESDCLHFNSPLPLTEYMTLGQAVYPLGVSIFCSYKMVLITVSTF